MVQPTFHCDSLEFEEYVKGGDGFDPRCLLIGRLMKRRRDRLRGVRLRVVCHMVV